MDKAGIVAFEKRDEARSQIYAYENASKLSEKYEKIFQNNKNAWGNSPHSRPDTNA